MSFCSQCGTKFNTIYQKLGHNCKNSTSVEQCYMCQKCGMNMGSRFVARINHRCVGGTRGAVVPPRTSAPDLPFEEEEPEEQPQRVVKPQQLKPKVPCPLCGKNYAKSYLKQHGQICQKGREMRQAPVVEQTISEPSAESETESEGENREG